MTLIALGVNILGSRKDRSHPRQPARHDRPVIDHEFIHDQGVLCGIALVLDKDDLVHPVGLQFVNGASFELLQRNLYLNPFSRRQIWNELSQRKRNRKVVISIRELDEG